MRNSNTLEPIVCFSLFTIFPALCKFLKYYHFSWIQPLLKKWGKTPLIGVENRTQVHCYQPLEYKILSCPFLILPHYSQYHQKWRTAGSTNRTESQAILLRGPARPGLALPSFRRLCSLGLKGTCSLIPFLPPSLPPAVIGLPHRYPNHTGLMGVLPGTLQTKAQENLLSLLLGCRCPQNMTQEEWRRDPTLTPWDKLRSWLQLCSFHFKSTLCGSIYTSCIQCPSTWRLNILNMWAMYGREVNTMLFPSAHNLFSDYVTFSKEVFLVSFFIKIHQSFGIIFT